MPSSYAHYRFGIDILPALPADIRRPIQRCRALFDLGLQGPDILFFHHLSRVSPVGELGSYFHRQSGEAFFSRICDDLEHHPAEESAAYLYGLLAHYCLDCACHPLVYRAVEEGISHSAPETEFDRFLLARDGCKKPHRKNISARLQLSPGQCQVVSRFYPGVSAGDISRCVRNMALAERLQTIPTRLGNFAAQKLTHAVGGRFSGKVRTIGPNPDCAHLNAPLLEQYRSAGARYPAYLEQLIAHMAYHAPFGALFENNFNEG